jgi:hypothetical protein
MGKRCPGFTVEQHLEWSAKFKKVQSESNEMVICLAFAYGLNSNETRNFCKYISYLTKFSKLMYDRALAVMPKGVPWRELGLYGYQTEILSGIQRKVDIRDFPGFSPEQHLEWSPRFSKFRKDAFNILKEVCIAFGCTSKEARTIGKCEYFLMGLAGYMENRAHREMPPGTPTNEIFKMYS